MRAAASSRALAERSRPGGAPSCAPTWAARSSRKGNACCAMRSQRGASYRFWHSRKVGFGTSLAVLRLLSHWRSLLLRVNYFLFLRLIRRGVLDLVDGLQQSGFLIRPSLGASVVVVLHPGATRQDLLQICGDHAELLRGHLLVLFSLLQGLFLVRKRGLELRDGLHKSRFVTDEARHRRIEIGHRRLFVLDRILSLLRCLAENIPEHVQDLGALLALSLRFFAPCIGLLLKKSGVRCGFSRLRVQIVANINPLIFGSHSALQPPFGGE